MFKVSRFNHSNMFTRLIPWNHCYLNDEVQVGFIEKTYIWHDLSLVLTFLRTLVFIFKQLLVISSFNFNSTLKRFKQKMHINEQTFLNANDHAQLFMCMFLSLCNNC
jgi:hypothetical protein